MRTEKQKLQNGVFLVTIGAIIIGLAGCEAYPPEAPRAQYYYGSGIYSYEDYPDTYYYYDSYGRPYRELGGYSNDPNLRYDARRRDPSHSDDHNFHNRNDFDHWDY